MTRGDRILILVVACVTLFSIPFVSMASTALAGKADRAVVDAPGGRTTLDLSRDARYEIQGHQGVLCLSVVAGEVRAVDADCPDRVCVRSGVARPGRPIVCAPNGVSVSLSGSSRDGVDAVSR